jgi:hypothetical protein
MKALPLLTCPEVLCALLTHQSWPSSAFYPAVFVEQGDDILASEFQNPLLFLFVVLSLRLG